MPSLSEKGAGYECILSETVDLYVNLSTNFSQDVSTALTVPMQTIFLSMVGLWIVIQGYRVIMAFITPLDIIKDFVFVFIAWTLLNMQGPELVNDIFSSALQVMGSGASVVMDTASSNNKVTGNFTPDGLAGMSGLVCYTETAMQNVWGVATSIADQTTLTNPLPLLYAIVLVLPYILVVVVYGAQTLVSIFRVLFLATISPYLMMAFGFGFFRQEAISGVRTLLASFLVLWAATISVAVLVYGVSEVSQDLQDNIMNADEGISIFNAKYLLVLVLGWAGTALLTEATGLANSITKSSLTNTAAGVMSAGMIGTGMAVAKAASGPAGAAASAMGIDPAKAVAKHAGGAIAQRSATVQRAQELYQKYNDYVYPDKGKK